MKCMQNDHIKWLPLYNLLKNYKMATLFKTKMNYTQSDDINWLPLYNLSEL
jgi:hypothetical protein